MYYPFYFFIYYTSTFVFDREIEEKYLAVSVSSPKVDLWDLTDIGEYLKSIAESTKDDCKLFLYTHYLYIRTYYMGFM